MYVVKLFFLAHLWTIWYFKVKIELTAPKKVSVVEMLMLMMLFVSELHWFLYLSAMQKLHHRVCAHVSGHLLHLTIKSETNKFSAVILSVVFLLWVLRVCSFSDVYDKPIKRLGHSSARLVFSLISNNASTQVEVDRCVRGCVLTAGLTAWLQQAGASDYQINVISLVDDVSTEKPNVM